MRQQEFLGVLGSAAAAWPFARARKVLQRQPVLAG